MGARFQIMTTRSLERLAIYIASLMKVNIFIKLNTPRRNTPIHLGKITKVNYVTQMEQ